MFAPRSGGLGRGSAISPAYAAFLERQRSGRLATVDSRGQPHAVPICYALLDGILYTPIDEKPKTPDPRSLARIRDIERRHDVSVLVDRWDEDWRHLAWLRCDGRATLTDDPAERTAAIAALRAKYPQYATHDLEERPLIGIPIDRVRSWGDLSGPGRLPSPSGGGSGSSSSPGRTRRR